MHKIIKNLNDIEYSIKSKISELKRKKKKQKILSVSKKFNIEHVMP